MRQRCAKIKKTQSSAKSFSNSPPKQKKIIGIKLQLNIHLDQINPVHKERERGGASGEEAEEVGEVEGGAAGREPRREESIEGGGRGGKAGRKKKGGRKRGERPDEKATKEECQVKKRRMKE